jgi:hypothetical protein
VPTKIKIKMHTAACIKEIRKEAQARMTIAADELRNALSEELNNGLLPIHSDTGALGISLSVQTPQGSDSQQRLGEAMAAYMVEGKWQDAVRRRVTPAAYTEEHFRQRVTEAEPLPLLNGQARAKVFTRLAYGFLWYAGHNNVFTGRDEGPRDWITPFAIEWMKVNAEKYFEGML